MEVVEAHYDANKRRSVEFYQDDENLFGFEEWFLRDGSDEWATRDEYGQRIYQTLEDAHKEAREIIEWFGAL